MIGEIDESHYYNILDNRSVRLQNRVSPIIKALCFQHEVETSDLFDAIIYFKEKDGVIGKNAPMEFLESQEREVIILNDVFRPSLYKVFFFLHVAGAIKSDQLNLEYSYKYRPLDEYLIPKERWQQEKETLLVRADLQNFSNPKVVLNELDHALLKQYKTTNRNINDTLNPYVKITTNGDFTVSTPKQEDQEIDQIAWKTGTSYGFRGAWAIGVSGDYIVAVWVGSFNGQGK